MVGPASNFAHIPVPGKWLMSFYMLVGRLEIYTVLFLFLPGYWKERK
jgi:trk system potassium uptake protein TrkH